MRGLGTGVALALGAYVAYAAGAVAIGGLYFSWLGKHPVTVSGADVFGRTFPVGGVLYVLLTPLFEELIVRAYVMTEVGRLAKSSAIAVLISVLLQTSYHLYYGWYGAVSLAFMFLVFAVYYSRTRDVFPVIVAHAALDYLMVISFAVARR
jgi:membrane protease YdiL (CAAX protease family)